MTNARVSEIFVSYQGEGPYAGSRQLFIRFYGCNRACSYCDTDLESYKTFTKDSLIGKLMEFEDDYNELVLTGGEPLIYADFLKGFLPLLRMGNNRSVYLETNGTLPAELDKIIEYIDIIAMDIKLPSSTKDGADLWDAHRKFCKIAEKKDLIVKAVITDDTNIDDIKRMASVLSGLDKECDIILQPVTPVKDSVKIPDGEMLEYFRKYIEKESGSNVIIMGQLHKILGVK